MTKAVLDANQSRRSFLLRAGVGLGTLSLAELLGGRDAWAARDPQNVGALGASVRIADLPKPPEEPGVEDNCPVTSRICTRELRPTVCSYEGQTFHGNNPCEARLNAQDAVCTASGAFEPAKLTCEADGPLF